MSPAISELNVLIIGLKVIFYFTINIFGKLVIISRTCFSLHWFSPFEVVITYIKVYFLFQLLPLQSLLPVLLLFSCPLPHSTPPLALFFFFLVEWLINSFMMIVFVPFLWHSFEAFRDLQGGIHKAKKAIYCEKVSQEFQETLWL